MGRWVQSLRDAGTLEARRMEGFALLSQGRSQRDVARQLGVTSAAVCHWQRAIDRGGRAALRAIPRPGRPPLIPREVLTLIPALLSAKVQEVGSCTNLSRISRTVRIAEERWGARYTQSGMSRLLRRYGVPRRPTR
ncbi:MAG: helix-turn-helix domain-containing protein [Thermoplasmata archaeon]